MIGSFQTTFAVPMTCDSCVKDVSRSLYNLPGVKNIEANLENQLVFVEGTAAPSSIVAAIQDTGRDAILRGSGTTNNASVCILETHANNVRNPIRGLARMVQVAPAMTVFDLTVNGIAPGRYWATIRERGDISDGAASTGSIWGKIKEAIGASSGGGGFMTAVNGSSDANGTLAKPSSPPCGLLGSIDVDSQGHGSVFIDRPVNVWELIGRSMVVDRTADGPFRRTDTNTLVGVIARSAGVWDNNKKVCSCSGKNVWEERRDQVGRGMM